MFQLSLSLILQPLPGSSPAASPSKEKYGDRFIPSRAGSNWHVNFNMIQVRVLSLFSLLSSPLSSFKFLSPFKVGG